MAKKKTDDMTVEEGFAALEEVLEKLEDPESTLEESFALYKNGVELLKRCNDMIDRVEKQIELLNEDGTIEPLDRDEE